MTLQQPTATWPHPLSTFSSDNHYAENEMQYHLNSDIEYHRVKWSATFISITLCNFYLQCSSASRQCQWQTLASPASLSSFSSMDADLNVSVAMMVTVMTARDVIGRAWITWCPQGGDVRRHSPESIWIGRQWMDHQLPSFGGGSFRYCHSKKFQTASLHRTIRPTCPICEALPMEYSRIWKPSLSARIY